MKDFIYKGVKFTAVGQTYQANVRGFPYTGERSKLFKRSARQSAKNYLDWVLRKPPERVDFSSGFKQNNGFPGRLTRSWRYRYWCRHYQKYGDNKKP